jgi:hypothetical protein
MLTVPEQYAGQLMKCPLCNSTFTVPALAPTTATGPEASPAPPPPQPAPAPAPEQSQHDVYAMREEPAPHTPAQSAQAIAAPPPAAGAPEPVAPTVAPPTHEPAARPARTLPEGYRRVHTLWFSARVMPYVAPVCLVLVFLLTFFSWVGVYPGGQSMVTVNAWGAAFGGGTSDLDMQETALIGKALKDVKPGANPFAGASVLAIFYLFLLILVVLPVTLASVVLDHLRVKLPPGIQLAMPWRWGIVAAANLVLYLFLLMQLALGFQMQSNYRAWVENNVGNPDAKTTPQVKVSDAERGMALEACRWAVALRMTCILHLFAVVAAVLMYWLDRRGPERPLPNLELRW